MITFLGALIVASMCLCLIFGENLLIRTVAIIFTFVSSIFLGSVSEQENGIKTKTPINPSIEVICKDTICDTTYIYKIKK
jgi:hypothetical protein